MRLRAYQIAQLAVAVGGTSTSVDKVAVLAEVEVPTSVIVSSKPKLFFVKLALSQPGGLVGAYSNPIRCPLIVVKSSFS